MTKAKILEFLKKTYRLSVLSFAVLRSSGFWLLAESVILITMSTFGRGVLQNNLGYINDQWSRLSSTKSDFLDKKWNYFQVWKLKTWFCQTVGLRTVSVRRWLKFLRNVNTSCLTSTGAHRAAVYPTDQGVRHWEVAAHLPVNENFHTTTKRTKVGSKATDYLLNMCPL